MAVGTWKIYSRSKKYIGAGTIVLGTGIFRMELHRKSASATIIVLSTRSVSTSIAAEISATGGYAARGRTIPGCGWTAGASAKQWKFKYTTIGIVFTASGAPLGVSVGKGIKYALIRNSTSATGGKVLCYCTLSTTAFTISTGNTLTILPASTGVFTLA